MEDYSYLDSNHLGKFQPSDVQMGEVLYLREAVEVQDTLLGKHTGEVSQMGTLLEYTDLRSCTLAWKVNK